MSKIEELKRAIEDAGAEVERGFLIEELASRLGDASEKRRRLIDSLRSQGDQMISADEVIGHVRNVVAVSNDVSDVAASMYDELVDAHRDCVEAREVARSAIALLADAAPVDDDDVSPGSTAEQRVDAINKHVSKICAGVRTPDELEGKLNDLADLATELTNSLALVAVVIGMRQEDTVRMTEDKLVEMLREAVPDTLDRVRMVNVVLNGQKAL